MNANNDSNYLVLNDFVVEENKILVAATDSESWQIDINDGQSGRDARSIFWAILVPEKSGYIGIEKVEFYCRPGDPLRSLAMNHVEKLLNVAWEIHKQKLTSEEVYKKYFGYRL